MNTFVIGDIHGNIDALNEVLALTPIKRYDTLVFLGDYCDGFPGTSEVVDKLIELNKTHMCIFLRGNHDVWTTKWILEGWRGDIWEQQGGFATKESYMNSLKFHDEDHKAFWRDLKNYYIDGENNLFVHGGWDGRKRFMDSVDEVRAGYPEILWNRDLAEGVTTQFTELFNNIFIGHTATRDHLPYNNKNIWNVDTGAGWDGKLTIMNVFTKEYWQSTKNLKSGR